MGAKSGLALKLLQWCIRAVQFLCAALVLGVFSYFLAALHNHSLPIATSVRAVEGIAGAAVLYTIIGLVLVCCLAGVAVASAIAILLDVCFVGAFIYVAYANRNGAGSCSGLVDTPFGSGPAGETAPAGTDGFTALPSFRTACRLQTACLAVAIAAIFFFIMSALMEVALVRHHRKEKRFGPGPANNYTSGYGSGRRLGFLNRLRRNRNAPPADDANALPEHTHPSQLGANARQSYATEATAVAHDPRAPSADYAKQETGYGYPPAAQYNHQQQQQQQQHLPAPSELPSNYRYGDGVYERA